MLKLTDRDWVLFKVGDVFTVYTGSLMARDILITGKIPRVTVKETNNGIDGYYRKVNDKNYRTLTNFISVSFLGGVFYHPYTASLDMKVHALKMKDKEYSKGVALFLVRAIRSCVSKFTYGDQLSSTDLPRQKILLPVNRDNEPDWQFMEDYINTREQKLLNEYKT
ncbi:MAG: restriction endonuclease subunit S [Spirochaetaceae bacterium]|jgi:hypothetical protein|nr:restriction endonuclease subunit S [Spirochaetaceae bacterium]